MVERYIGFHARGLSELKQIVEVAGTNLVELKPERFERDGYPIYRYSNGRFTLDRGSAAELAHICRGKKVQIHLPYEECHDVTVERGLCQADPNHHPILLKRYEMISYLFEKYGIGSTVTMHPPGFRFGKERTFTEFAALRGGRIFYCKLDELIEKNNWSFRVGIENLVPPKDEGGNVGYQSEDFRYMLKGMRNIGITVDTGHRLLNEEISIRELLRIAPVVNMHFHTNSGKQDPHGWNDDEHQLATEENLPHYSNYIDTARSFNIPVVLEIANLRELDKKTLERYVADLKSKLERAPKP